MPPEMNPDELADVLIQRLNTLIEDSLVRHEIGVFLNSRLACSDRLLEHPTIQVVRTAEGAPTRLGFLGLLNGLVGIIPEGPKKGWGLITAEFDDVTGALLCFKRTES